MARLTTHYVVLAGTLALVFAPSLASAQNAVLSGVIVNGTTERPIAGVHVQAATQDPSNPTSFTTLTNQDGRYRLELPDGAYILTASVLGYAQASDTIQARRGATFDHSFVLSAVPIRIEDLIVVPYRRQEPARCDHFSDCIDFIRQVEASKG